MKYYSETLQKLFESEKALVEAEKQAQEEKEKKEAEKKALTEKRATRAKEIEEAYKAIIEAKNHYNELKNKFIEDYGSYHLTVNTKTPIDNIETLSDLFNFWLNF